MKKKILIISVCAVLVLAISGGGVYYYHPTHFKYNDHFVIGKTEEEIVARYGSFSQVRRNDSGEIAYGTYMVRDNTPELLMGYDDSLWYEVYFDDGIAVEIRLQEGWYGG